MESLVSHNNVRPVYTNSQITRTPENPVFKALWFHSWGQLAQALDVNDYRQDVVLTDLSQGAWQGHWIARQLQKQLGLPESGLVQPVLHENNYADTVGRLIDNESEGDKNFILSLKNCIEIRSALLQKGVSWVVVIPPAVNCRWEQENLQFMKLLYHALQHSRVQVVLLLFENSTIPENWDLQVLNEPHPGKKTIAAADESSFSPGIWAGKDLPAEYHDTGQLAFLNQFYVMPDPVLRQSILHGMNVADLLDGEPHLLAAYQIMFTDDPDFRTVHEQAALRFAEGGYGIALRLLALLQKKLKNPFEREATRSKIQNIRIALMQFEDAANEHFSANDLPDMFKASLSQSKAWGLVMSNRPYEAEPFFEIARKYLNEKEHPRLYLYLLNISALNKLRIGLYDEALKLEKRIENSLNSQKKRDWHITYINNINQARLYKKAGRYDVAEKYYYKAFEVNSYLKNESDLLYTNFCLARLEELKGNHRRAFVFWLRSCIHWLSNPVPESLAPRVARAILRKNLSGENDDVEEISSQLSRLFLQSLKNNGLDIKIPKQGFIFTRPGHSAHRYLNTVGHHGWGVCISEQKTPRCYNGPNYGRLGELVSAVMRYLLPVVDWSTIQTVVADAQYGEELPATPGQLLLLSARTDTPLIFGNKQYAGSKKEREQARKKIKAGFNPAIDFVTKKEKSYIVFFKRYLPPLSLNARETSILEDLQFQKNNLEVTTEEWFELARKRVVQLYVES